jgi:hypothetical protein
LANSLQQPQRRHEYTPRMRHTLFSIACRSEFERRAQQRGVGVMFRKKLEELINRESMENGCNCPDFILADYLMRCLETFDISVKTRDKWYGVQLCPGNSRITVDNAPADTVEAAGN